MIRLYFHPTPEEQEDAEAPKKLAKGDDGGKAPAKKPATKAKT